MQLTDKISNHNFRSFLWHAAFLALAQNFMDVDTIIPSMVVESGGSAIHIGLMTAIMLGGSRFTQLFFAPYISNKMYKKKYLLTGINARVFSLMGLGYLLFNSAKSGSSTLWLIFIFITIFSLGGAFANISYSDMIGKTISQKRRKSFFSIKQMLTGSIILGAAFLAKKILILVEYPVNYSLMFFIGSIALLIAALGFWSIKETVPSQLKMSYKDFLPVLKEELLKNRQLKYFLGFINTQGIAISFLPFVVLYSREIFNTKTSDTGSFLLFKVLGIVCVSIMVLLGAKKIKYKILLYGNSFLTVLMTVTALTLNNPSTLKYIFFMGGIIFSLYTITMNGVLLEISTTEKRAIYTGFMGAGNILPAVFPLIGGTMINFIGFTSFFILFILTSLLSVFFIYKLRCVR